MFPQTGCPCTETFQALIDGRIDAPRQAELTAHLDVCEDCQHRLDALAAGDGGWCAAACRCIDEERPTDDSAFWPAMRQVRLATATAAVTPPDPADTGEHQPLQPADVDLSFLSPPSRPEFLGRLGRYNVVGVIGRGGMGLVLKALDVCLQRQVAVKVLDPQFAKNDAARDRFHREALTAAAVQHENVVAIHTVEKEGPEKLPYLVMQLVAGESLQDRLDRGEPMPLRQMLDVARQTALGLAAAHERGLIHRDIKPGNVLLETGTGRVKLTDFGLARCTESVKLTQTGFVAGTPLYMSPEQARGEPLDARSDLFSLGSVLYALAAGAPPFEASSPFLVMKKITEMPSRPLREVNPAVPEGFADIVDHLLEKRPADRPESAAMVAEAITAEIARLPQSEDKTAVVPTAPRRSTVAQTACPPLRSRLALLSVGTVTGLVLALAASGVWWLRTTPLPATGIPPLGTFPPNNGAVWSVAFSPDAKTLAVAVEDGSIKFCDVASLGVKFSLPGHTGPVWTVAYSRDGARTLTASDDGTAIVWGTDGKPMRTIRSPIGSFTSAAFSPDGTVVATGDRQGRLRLWSVDDGLQRQEAKAHDGIVRVVAFSPDGAMVATAGSDSTVKLWDAKTGKHLADLTGHSGPVYTISFAPDGRRLASGGWDKAVRVWDVLAKTHLATFEGQGHDVWAVRFAPGKDDERLAVGRNDGSVVLLDPRNGKLLVRYEGHDRPVHCLAFSCDGKLLASGGRDGNVKLWDATAGR